MVVADERVLLRGRKVTIDGRAGVQMMSGAKCGRTRKGFRWRLEDGDGRTQNLRARDDVDYGLGGIRWRQH